METVDDSVWVSLVPGPPQFESRKMMSVYSKFLRELQTSRRRWLVSGAAGFIGTHLVETLLNLGQEVVGIDNLSAGGKANLEAVLTRVSPDHKSKFEFYEMDISDIEKCRRHCEGIQYVLHQAALTSVPRSIKEPFLAHRCNVEGFLKLALAAQESGVEAFVYASSASVYGQGQGSPLSEEAPLMPASPYGTTKWIDEIYAQRLGQESPMRFFGLRYFNVIGPGQDATASYAAVVPRWIHALVRNERTEIFGDGETTRDFCDVEDVVQANLLAAVTPTGSVEICNIGSGLGTRLVELHETIVRLLKEDGIVCPPNAPRFGPFRAGDVDRSVADISKAIKTLGYAPEVSLEVSLKRVIRHALGKGWPE